MQPSLHLLHADRRIAVGPSRGDPRLRGDRPPPARFPLDADHAWERAKVVPGKEVLARIGERFPLVAEPNADGPAPARTFRFADGAPGSVGVIASVTEPFCDSCDRMRITADGQFRSCL